MILLQELEQICSLNKRSNRKILQIRASKCLMGALSQAGVLFVTGLLSAIHIPFWLFRICIIFTLHSIQIDKNNRTRVIDMRGLQGETLILTGDRNYDFAKLYQSH